MDNWMCFVFVWLRTIRRKKGIREISKNLFLFALFFPHWLNRDIFTGTKESYWLFGSTRFGHFKNNFPFLNKFSMLFGWDCNGSPGSFFCCLLFIFSFSVYIARSHMCYRYEMENRKTWNSVSVIMVGGYVYIGAGIMRIFGEKLTISLFSLEQKAELVCQNIWYCVCI